MDSLAAALMRLARFARSSLRNEAVLNLTRQSPARKDHRAGNAAAARIDRMFGNRNRPKKKFYWELISGDPIAVKHNRPKSVDGDWKLAGDEDRSFFDDFYAFGDVVNWWLSDERAGSSWRLQEMADTELRLSNSDSPEFGRRYEIYRGPIKSGVLEISANLLRYHDGKKGIWATIELQWVRLLSYEAVTDILSAIATHVDSSVESSHRIHGAMTRALWDSLSIDDDGLNESNWGTLEVSFEGEAEFYFRRFDALVNRGR